MRQLNCPENLKAHAVKVLNGEYDATFECVKPVILDIGAGVGDFAIWALDKWPDATIYSYEPIKSTFSYLQENVKGLNVRAFNAAIRWQGKTGVMYHGFHNDGEASFYKTYQQNDDTERVRIICASSLPEADIIKIDTEGCEFEILNGILPRKGLVLCEVHNSENLWNIIELLDSTALTYMRTSPERWLLKALLKSHTV